MMWVFWILFGYCLAERLFEIRLSARNRERMHGQGFQQRESTSPMVSMVFLHVSWFMCLLTEVFFAPTVLPPWITSSAITLFLLAQIVRAWVFVSLGKFWNVSVMSPGTGDSRFVQDGPYRFIRHPNYAVVIMELLTLPLSGGAPLTALIFTILNALVLKHRIALEERHLFEIPGYKEAMGAKGRFLPRLMS